MNRIMVIAVAAAVFAGLNFGSGGVIGTTGKALAQEQEVKPTPACLKFVAKELSKLDVYKNYDLPKKSLMKVIEDDALLKKLAVKSCRQVENDASRASLVAQREVMFIVRFQ